MIVEVLGGLGVALRLGRHALLLEPPKGEGLFTNSPPFYRRPSPEGSSGPFSWRPVELEGLRGKVTGYEILARDLRVFYAGGTNKPLEVEADLLIAPAGGAWYLDAKGFCESVRKSSVKAAVPVAIWWPGSMSPFEGIEEVRAECRGFRRVRAKKRWKVNFEGVKATVALLEPV